MSKKMILVSGPKLCGKGTLLAAALSQFEHSHDVFVKEAACKGHLYKLVQDIFLVSEERFWEIYNDREFKEKPMPEFKIYFGYEEAKKFKELVGDGVIKELSFGGKYFAYLSIRHAMIYVSEILMKPLLGSMNYFGRARMEGIKSFVEKHSKVVLGSLVNYVFYDDSSACFNGSSDELVGLVDYFGEDNILLINIRGRGEFGVGDSRNYHADGTVKYTVDLWNTGTEQEFLDKGCKIIQDFLNRGS